MSGLTQADYVKAYQGILTTDDIRLGEREANEFAAGIPNGAPRSILRFLGRFAKVRTAAVEGGVTKADKQGIDYSSYTQRLSGAFFQLDQEEGRLIETNGLRDIATLFRQGQESSWPTLVLTSNSNLTSPQAFFDTIKEARDTVADAGVTGPIIVVGSYMSAKNLYRNASASTTRYHQLDNDPHSAPPRGSAGEMQGQLLLELISKRDKDGELEFKADRRILRTDAGRVIDHVVGYGYSAGHMANKDGLRYIVDQLSRGNLLAEPQTETEFLRVSTYLDAYAIIPRIGLVANAGMDNMRAKLPGIGPMEANVVSEGDLSLSLLGKSFIEATNVIKIVTPDAPGKPLEGIYGGHAESAYSKALRHPVNSDALSRVRNAVNRKPGF